MHSLLVRVRRCDFCKTRAELLVRAAKFKQIFIRQVSRIPDRAANSFHPPRVVALSASDLRGIIERAGFQTRLVFTRESKKENAATTKRRLRMPGSGGEVARGVAEVQIDSPRGDSFFGGALLVDRPEV